MAAAPAIGDQKPNQACRQKHRFGFAQMQFSSSITNTGFKQMPRQQKLAALNEQFAIEGQLQFNATGDLIVADISNQHAMASIALQGAQVLSWVAKKEDTRGANEQQPLIWLSDEATFIAGKTIRGGIPVCWPWFGAHPDRDDYPAHGFVRAVDWDVVETSTTAAGQTNIVFRLPQTQVPLALWSHNTELVSRLVN
jgi:D-hexose-6-phosphate mutarotase